MRSGNAADSGHCQSRDYILGTDMVRMSADTRAIATPENHIAHTLQTLRTLFVHHDFGFAGTRHPQGDTGGTVGTQSADKSGGIGSLGRQDHVNASGAAFLRKPRQQLLIGFILHNQIGQLIHRQDDRLQCD